jgi:hypothetical protein
MLPVDRKKRHKFCKKTQNFRPFLRQLKQALACAKRTIFKDYKNIPLNVARFAQANACFS